MVKMTLASRKSDALTPSRLRCLSHMPTINITAGCVHACAYCYIRGYRQYPGDDAVVVYQNTAEQVQRELQRKRERGAKLPAAVYFCPSSDAFMPLDAVLDQSYRTMSLLLDQGIGVQFVTKGGIPDRFFDLFARYFELVAGQIGLTTLDNWLNAMIEPGAASAERRLDDLARLVGIGVTASLRADPLIHGVTDLDAGLHALFAAASARGINDVSASYLFLRPGIVGSLKRSIDDPDLLRRILAPFECVKRSSACVRQLPGTSLSAEVRRFELHRVSAIAAHHGLRLRICGCKNEDLTSGKCHLTRLAATPRSRASDAQLSFGQIADASQRARR